MYWNGHAYGYWCAPHANTAKACAYELGVDNCAWCDCEDGEYGPQTHIVNQGSYKVVANVPDGRKVCMLVDDDPGIAKEIVLMKKLRNEIQIKCVPSVLQNKELTLDQQQSWLNQIIDQDGVNQNLVFALEMSIDAQKRIIRKRTKVQQEENHLQAQMQTLETLNSQNVKSDEIKNLERSIWHTTQLLEALRQKCTKLQNNATQTWYIEEEDVGIDLDAMIKHQSAQTDGDYFTTCCNLLSLLRDVRTMIGDKHKIFNCDVKTQNVTGRLEYNYATQKSGLRFYVVDWGLGQQLNSHTKLPDSLPMFFYDSQLSQDRTLQIPDEFVTCFMCFHVCVTDSTKTVQEHRQHISQATLRKMWTSVRKYAMFRRFARANTQHEKIWKSTQCFLAQCGTSDWESELNELRAKEDNIRAEAFMRFMIDYFISAYKITTQQQALINMMQRVECWAYANTFLEFWPTLLPLHPAQGTYVPEKQRHLHGFIMQQLEELVLSESSFSALKSVIAKIEEKFRTYVSTSLKRMQRTRLDAYDYYHTCSNVVHFLHRIAQKADARDSSLFTGLKDDHLLVYRCGILNTEQSGLAFFMHPDERMPTGIHAECALNYNLTQYFDMDRFDSIDNHQTPPDFYIIWVVVCIFIIEGESTWKEFMTYDDLQLALKLFNKTILDVIPVTDAKTLLRVWKPVRDACLRVYSTSMHAAQYEQSTIEDMENFLCKTTGHRLALSAASMLPDQTV